MTDNASYTDMVFGLFRMFGMFGLFGSSATSSPPRIADLGDTRFWRVDAGADYGPLNALARRRVNLARVGESWPDMLRVGGSLNTTGTVRAYDLIRMLSRDGHPSRLGRAHYQDPAPCCRYIDADDTYRCQTIHQLTVNEGRHQLARRIFHGARGELRQRYREGREDQLGDSLVGRLRRRRGGGGVPGPLRAPTMSPRRSASPCKASTGNNELPPWGSTTGPGGTPSSLAWWWGREMAW